jgi:hypothetical protein
LLPNKGLERVSLSYIGRRISAAIELRKTNFGELTFLQLQAEAANRHFDLPVLLFGLAYYQGLFTFPVDNIFVVPIPP